MITHCVMHPMVIDNRSLALHLAGSLWLARDVKLCQLERIYFTQREHGGIISCDGSIMVAFDTLSVVATGGLPHIAVVSSSYMRQTLVTDIKVHQHLTRHPPHISKGERPWTNGNRRQIANLNVFRNVWKAMSQFQWKPIPRLAVGRRGHTQGAWGNSQIHSLHYPLLYKTALGPTNA